MKQAIVDWWNGNNSSVESVVGESDTEVLASFSPYSFQSANSSVASYNSFNGDKFAGGFGDTEIVDLNYWELRTRSAQMFSKNMYARGIIRRMVTNEINTGLTLEAAPETSILGLPDNSLKDWTDDVEKRWEIFNANLFDHMGVNSAGTISRIARRESLIEGDILVIMRTDENTGNPQVQLVPGNKVRTPLDRMDEKIVEGVALDANNNHIAFYVLQDDNTFIRIPVYGAKTGRKRAWLMYAIDKRYNDVRGEPLLSIMLQSLKEIDRYRDAAQRKAVINSILAMVVEKGEERIGTMPMTGAATTRGRVEVADTTDSRTLNVANYGLPGVIADELQYGEKIHAFKTEADVDFGKFEEIIIQAIAWSTEMPPEILRQTFSSNYSASQASINEYKLYLNPTREYFAEQWNKPFYKEWLISETLTGRIKCPGLIRAVRENDVYAMGAWFVADWVGAIKPSSDMYKMTKAAKLAIDEGLVTRSRMSSELFGTKYDRVAKQLQFENQKLVEAHRPIAEFNKEFAVVPGSTAVNAQLEKVTSAQLEAIVDAVYDELKGDEDHVSH